MLGYFVLKEKAEELGFLNDPEIMENFQKTYFIVTERDVNEIEQLKLNSVEFDNISNFLNKNYFESMVEQINQLVEANKK